ncbi:ExbD/TolR family protein [Arenimonas sp.]|jgi:biopolymer transport protein ExbD|uniref:ExbD/TolR family protein n=1 Tax=Arenimonas sp. TaxID=1872635 RepID=UPI0037C1B47C
MRLDTATGDDDVEINLTALIDVVFTLIIFFVVTTSFNNRSALKITLPSSAASQVEAQRQPLVVLIDKTGNYYVGDIALARSDLVSLKDAIRQQAGNDTDRTIVIQADAKTSHQSVITAMDAIGQLGFSKLSIATAPETQGEP